MVANVGAQTRPSRKTQQFSRRNVDTFSIILYRGVKTTFRGVRLQPHCLTRSTQHTRTHACTRERVRGDGRLER